MNENLANEVRKTIESVKDMKIQVGGINNYLSILEGLARADYRKQVDEAYQRGYKACMKENDFDSPCTSCEAYRKGLDDAWEAAKKIILSPDEGGTSLPDLFAVFDNGSMQRVFRNYSASEAIAKLKAYEEKQNNKFEFGDEIIDSNGVKGCVVSKDNEGLDTMYVLFDGCRVPQYVSQSNYRKTGRHFDIDKILEAMK